MTVKATPAAARATAPAPTPVVSITAPAAVAHAWAPPGRVVITPLVYALVLAETEGRQLVSSVGVQEYGHVEPAHVSPIESGGMLLVAAWMVLVLGRVGFGLWRDRPPA